MLRCGAGCGDPKADARARTERQLLELMAEHPTGAAERFLAVQEVDRGLGRRLGARAAAPLATAWPDLTAEYERMAAGHAVERVRGLVPDAPLELRDPTAQMIEALSAGAPALAQDWQALKAKVAAAEVRALEAARADQRPRLALRIAPPGDPGDQLFAELLAPALAKVLAAHLPDLDVFVPDATPPTEMPAVSVTLALTHADYTGPGGKVELQVIQQAAVTFTPRALVPAMTARLGPDPFVLEATAWTPESILVRPLGGLNLELGGGSAAVTAMNALVEQLQEALRQRLVELAATVPDAPRADGSAGAAADAP